MSVRLPSRRVSPAERRADLWLALALLIGAIISAWLGQVAGVYGDETPAFGWALVYSAALTLPLALRRRYPEVVLLWVAAMFYVGASLRIPEIYVGNVAVFIAMYTVGAWVADRRRATVVRWLVIAGMFVWLLVTTFQAATADGDGGLSRAGLFSPFAAYMLLQFLVNVAFFGGAYLFGERAWAQARSRAALEERTRELERERELTAAQAVALDRVRIAREACTTWSPTTCRRWGFRPAPAAPCSIVIPPRRAAPCRPSSSRRVTRSSNCVSCSRRCAPPTPTHRPIRRCTCRHSPT